MESVGIGQFIRRERERRGWTQAFLAEHADVSRARIAQIEGGRVALPGADVRRRLANALGVRHVDILVAAGELAPDEITEMGTAGVRYPADTVQAEVLSKLAAMTDAQAEAVAVFMELVLARGYGVAALRGNDGVGRGKESA